MSIYNERTRHCTMEDVTISTDARTAAALYWLARYHGHDADDLGDIVAEEAGNCEPEGNTNGDLTIQIHDELARVGMGTA